MKSKSYTEATYLISQVSEMLDIHPQTLRQYERESLIVPSRTDGRIRLYSLEDIDRIKLILFLTRQKGVNIAGVKIILQLQEKMDFLENENHILKTKLHKETSSKALVIKETKFEIILFESK
ncbi:MAG TPA: MerR family transcriptional regulator [Arcobacter sp.]|jgi:MerR family transcriptional regulator/heat shock protein HspR|nr:MerR family transcriptional regulator [Arcobacter sp.]